MLAVGYGPAGRGRDIERVLSHVKPWLEEIQEVSCLILCNSNFGDAHVLGGHPLTALQFLKRAHDLTENGKNYHSIYLLFGSIARSHLGGGDPEAALRYCIRAIDLRQKVAGRYLMDFAEANHADILLSLGRSEEAIALAEKIVATRHGSSCMMALLMAERIWGSALSRLGKDAAEVDAHLRNSLSIADSVGNVLEALDTEIAWGQAMLKRQNPTGARTYFHRARGQLTDEMLPLARDRFLRTLEEGLKRCEPSCGYGPHGTVIWFISSARTTTHISQIGQGPIPFTGLARSVLLPMYPVPTNSKFSFDFPCAFPCNFSADFPSNFPRNFPAKSPFKYPAEIPRSFPL